MQAEPVDIAALKRAHPIEDIVEQTVHLRREGKGYRGLCPFHTERTPSFFVYPDPATGGIWYCYSARCQRGGDVITFLRLRDGLSFREAVAYLQKPGRASPRLSSGG
jgi:DNA primase